METNEGKFNFGIDTLQRISQTLSRIKMICELPPNLTRQRLHIDAVKTFFSDAGVLMSLSKDTKGDLSKYSKEIDNLQLSTRTIRGKRIVFYDINLEKRLFQIVREISIILNKYYMTVKYYDEVEY